MIPGRLAPTLRTGAYALVRLISTVSILAFIIKPQETPCSELEIRRRQDVLLVWATRLASHQAPGWMVSPLRSRSMTSLGEELGPCSSVGPDSSQMEQKPWLGSAMTSAKEAHAVSRFKVIHTKAGKNKTVSRKILKSWALMCLATFCASFSTEASCPQRSLPWHPHHPWVPGRLTRYPVILLHSNFRIFVIIYLLFVCL